MWPNGCAGPFERSREDPPQGTTGGERRGRVWKPHDHRRAASAPLESCHEPGRSAPPLTGQQSAALGAHRPSRAVGSRSAGCRRSFSDEPPYRSQISFLFKSKGAESIGSLSDGPNPLLEDSFFCRALSSVVGLGGASTSVGRVTYRVACDRETGTSDAVGRATVAVRAADAAAHRRVHNDALVVREDVETWPTCWPGTPAAGLGTKGGHQGLVGSIYRTRLSFYPYGSWGRHISSRSVARDR